ncbi:MAG: GNAT family N-acetyltransferase [Deltaproteobacteria bacterium]|nr:GNAT family N-acetyltransferase [Deltaproteobacteria bacterium]
MGGPRISTPSVTPARVSDLEASGLEDLAWVLARAFRDNPLNLAVIGGSKERRVRSNRQGMRTTLAGALGRAMVLAAGSGSEPLAGGLVALPPLQWPLPPPPLGLQLRTLIGQGLRVARRWGQIFHELGSLHPIRPHWYLAVVGVEPDVQGRGVGSELLHHFTRQVDADAQPAYLETDRFENVALYEHFGFDVESEIRVRGVPVWRMWRDARSYPEQL